MRSASSLPDGIVDVGARCGALVLRQNGQFVLLMRHCTFSFFRSFFGPLLFSSLHPVPHLIPSPSSFGAVLSFVGFGFFSVRVSAVLWGLYGGSGTVSMS